MRWIPSVSDSSSRSSFATPDRPPRGGDPYTPIPVSNPIRSGAMLAVAAITLLALPAPVLGHQLVGRYESPLPLVAYLGAAAFAVALSFALVLSRPVAPTGAGAEARRRTITAPRALRMGLRIIGLIGWGLVVGQALGGGSGAADPASLVLWVYGWVGLAIVSVLVGPAWRWIDPFATLHDAGAGLLRGIGLTGWQTTPYPPALARWPAVVGLGAFIWFELAVHAARGGATLGVILIGYTALTLLCMAIFGRDSWRTNGEVFSVWFGTLNRMAPLDVAAGAPAGRPEGTLEVRRLGAGLRGAEWSVDRLVLVALAIGAVIFDGLSQTQPWYDLFGQQAFAGLTGQLLVFLGLIVAAVLVTGRIVGVAALGAGLVPVAAGYVIAHYLTYLLVDGQRIVIVLSDPFALGWDLIGTAAFEPTGDWLPPAIVWVAQVVAVVGGHVIGAVAGHDVAVREALAEGGDETSAIRRARRRQVPLAILMVCLTTLTLWSLGQNLVGETDELARVSSIAQP